MSQEKEFHISGKSVAAAAAIVALPVATVIAVGQNEQRNTNAEIAAEVAAQPIEQREAYERSIEAAIEADYDAKQLVGEISIQSGSLGEAGLTLVQTALGDDLYEQIHDRIYSPLMDSAKHYVAQPDEKFSVVSVDLNPEANDGDEYVIVRPDHVIHSDLTTLESPDTH